MTGGTLQSSGHIVCREELIAMIGGLPRGKIVPMIVKDQACEWRLREDGSWELWEPCIYESMLGA